MTFPEYSYRFGIFVSGKMRVINFTNVTINGSL